jgi:hypothetical protein
MEWDELDREYPRFRDARGVLAAHGITLGPNGSTLRQLATELARRGWRWELFVDSARAEKAYAPTGTVSQTMIALGDNQVATMATVLADAIQFDEDHGLSPITPFRADILVRSPNGQAVAAVEVKNREGMTRQHAVEFRRNLVVHSVGIRRLPFFLLVSQDVGFLWSATTSVALESPPDLEFSMLPVVNRYVSWLRAGERLSGVQLELVVKGWFVDLALTGLPPIEEPDVTLAKAGFVDAIAGASIVTDGQL